MIQQRSKISRMESPTVNFVFIARKKSDGGCDAAVRMDLRAYCSKMDDVKASSDPDFLILLIGIQRPPRSRLWLCRRRCLEMNFAFERLRFLRDRTTKQNRKLQ